mmetsp:Transcript_18044/g.27280  ORF Transcript_18044/g.27280 Transcript_18044/m.27280 type:complete len:848 (-) Transcript_18044:86-2629(-)
MMMSSNEALIALFIVFNSVSLLLLLNFVWKNYGEKKKKDVVVTKNTKKKKERNNSFTLTARKTSIDHRADAILNLSDHINNNSISSSCGEQPANVVDFNSSLTSFFDKEDEDVKCKRRQDFEELHQLEGDDNNNNNTNMRQSVRSTRNKIMDWTEKQELRKTYRATHKMRNTNHDNPDNRAEVIKRYLRRRDWLESMVELDPRQQIRSYFNEVARQGGPLDDPLCQAPLDLICGFQRAGAFSVWRPTSYDAMALMMKKQGTGKGLDVKGKSAKRGALSGTIPFIQIHEEKHKQIGKLGLSRSGRLRVYYRSEKLRSQAVKSMRAVGKKMKSLPTSSEVNLDTINEQDIRWDVDDYKIYDVNLNNNDATCCCFGIDVSERVFYEACVLRQDIRREGDMVTGRPSEPNFQSMNFDSVRLSSVSSNREEDTTTTSSQPRSVVLQTDDTEPLRPQTLVVAYEENSVVQPCVSDFDCFIVGTRGIVYDEKLADDQVEVMKWMTRSIETILEKSSSSQNNNNNNDDDDNDDNRNRNIKSWSSHWFDILNNSNEKKKKTQKQMPRFGYGDPKSYQVMEGAVARSVHNRHGAVRHGAECFNYSFPQEIDDKLLVIADNGDFSTTNNTNTNKTKAVPCCFAYLTPTELQKYMMKKVEDGYVFPLNPKWVVADQGWKRVYDKLLSRNDPRTQLSLETWYPKESGIREQIETICQKYPDGFSNTNHQQHEGTEEMDLLEQKLRRQQILKRALLKFRAVRSFALLSSSTGRKKKKTLGAAIQYILLKKRINKTTTTPDDDYDMNTKNVEEEEAPSPSSRRSNTSASSRWKRGLKKVKTSVRATNKLLFQQQKRRKKLIA